MPGANEAPREKLLPIGDFLRHVQEQLAIFFVGFAQQAAKLVEITRLLAGATPSDIVGGPALGKVRQLRRFFTIVEELIKWALKSASQLFQRFNGRDSMTIFDTGNVATK